jgi:hypothetical protein
MSDTGTLITGSGIPLYRWLAIKHAIRLEAKGIRLSRGRSATAIAKSELGLKRNLPRAEVLEAVEEKIRELEANLEPGDISSI